MALSALLALLLAAPQPLPQLPSATATPPASAPAPSTAGPSAPSAPAATPPASLEHVRRGVVQIEQSGRPMAIGAILGKDGRILTALSGIGGLEQVDVRYADGSVVKARVGHKDKIWDLALLVPLSGKWTDGLAPTDADPTGAEVRAFLPKSGKLAPAQLEATARGDARSRDGDMLRSVLEIDLKGNPAVPGTPLLDANGHVVGMLVRACKDKEQGKDAASSSTSARPAPATADAGAAPNACTTVTVGAPVYALRAFLVRTPATAVQPAPWLGLGGAPTEAGNVRGVRVVGVAPGSPAEKAGLTSSGSAPDTIVAVDGQPVESPEQLAEAIAKHAVGQQVKLLVFSAGKFREASVTLRPAP